MLLRGTERSENRRLTAIGVVAMAVAALITALIVVVRPHQDSGAQVNVTIEAPYVGQGVAPGTHLLLHGLQVGEITEVNSIPGGGVRLRARFDPDGIVGLTDTFRYDFRPANYFGVTAVAITPSSGGSPIRDGMVLTREPDGNFTMQTLLSRLGSVSGGVLTSQLVATVDKATRYTDGLRPLIESGLIATDALARVQDTSTERLMSNAADISDAFPVFLQGAITATRGMVESKTTEASEKEYREGALVTLDLISNNLFGAVGKLLSSHQSDLAPLTRMLGISADTVAILVDDSDFGRRADVLRTRLSRIFTSDNGAVRLQLVLDTLPAMEAALGQAGALDHPTRGGR